jgi:hypothetical protein
MLSLPPSGLYSPSSGRHGYGSCCPRASTCAHVLLCPFVVWCACAGVPVRVRVRVSVSVRFLYLVFRPTSPLSHYGVTLVSYRDRIVTVGEMNAT